MSNLKQKYQTNLETALTALSLDRTEARPMHMQLTEALRSLILNGTAKPNARLPPSRVLAAELSVSRSTVISALDQLTSEGYLTGQQGAGTFVAPDLPHLITPSPKKAKPDTATQSRPITPFHPGVPDLRLFPYRQWARHLETAWRNPDPELMHLPDPCGWMPLRRAIADHLSAWRSVECSAEQVIVTAGGSHGFNIIAALLGNDKPAVIESPIYPVMQTCFEEAGLFCQPISVDNQGLDPDHLPDNAAAAVVTPSRQFPLGMTMPVARRLSLLDWADRNNALIIEDDYDSEFRYQGQPLPALASFDRSERTIYMGSFSKLLSASLRLGYLVVPESLLKAARKIAENSHAQPSLTPQPALAAFMECGDFARHIRKTRRIYAKRHKYLHVLLATHLSGYLSPAHQPTGMHIFCDLGPKLAHTTDAKIAALGKSHNQHLRPLSAYSQVKPVRKGLVLGFAGFEEVELEQAVEQLKELLHSISG